MKFNINKVTSVTLLASMLLTSVSPPTMAVTAYAADQEVTERMSEPLSEAAAQMESMCQQESELDVQTECTEETDRETEVETAAPSETEICTEPVTEEAEQNGQIPVMKEEREEQPTKEETETVPSETEASESEIVRADYSELLDANISVEREDSSDAVEYSDAAGNPKKLKLMATNQSDETAYFRLYFWDYDGEERNTKEIPDELLQNPCEDIIVSKCGQENNFSVYVVSDSGEEAVETVAMRSEYASDQLTARYLEMELPSHCSLIDTFQMTDEKAEKIVLDPILVVEEEEYKQDRAMSVWIEKAAVNAEANESGESVSEENEREDESGDIPETETEAASEVETESVSEIEEDDGESIVNMINLEIPDYLSEADFASKRLLVMISNETQLLENEFILDTYGDIYLIEYATVEDCMAAYVYYMDVADAVEPDSIMEIASDQNSNEKTDSLEEALSLAESASVLSDGITRVIALLDTGASSTGNVIDRVSLIDDVLEGHSHGNDMVRAIASQNPNAQILSIRVMGNDGRGTVSSIVAGMEYAMNYGVSIINLSLSSRTNELNAVIEAEIQKAVSMGILVVGAAGNNAADVMHYMPGSVSEACIIGACNNNGVRIASSNYGATVDYNVIAGTTSEAAAKFSGYASLAGLEAMKVNSGILYASDYVAGREENTQETETEQREEDDQLSEEEKNDMAGSEEDGLYPANGTSISDKVKIWIRDVDYDFSSYNPYKEDENVIVRCVSEVPASDHQVREEIRMEYECSLKSDGNHKWFLYVTFVYTEDRNLVSEGSDLLASLMPEMVNQERNEGYGGIVPEQMGEIVEGRTFTVLKGDDSFDLHGLLIDYNPDTFKVNNLTDDGNFDVNKVGTYTVVYEMSYFLYPEYTWYVANKVNVIDKEELRPGIYLTSRESTLMFKRESDANYWGYGDLVRINSSEEIFSIRCMDEAYEMELTSSSETVSTDIFDISENKDGSRLLRAAVPNDLEETVIFSMYRPGYESAKFFFGGGWANGEEHNLEEVSIDQLTGEEMVHLEDTVLGLVDEDADEYMEIAATWTTVESKNISGRVKTGSANTTNHSWAIGSAGGCNYGTAQITEKRDDIDAWISSKGYDINTKELTNFNVNCSSGHDYLGLWPNRYYSVTLKCYIQKNGDNYRLKITCSLHPGSDSHGNYQGFYGSKTYSSLTNGARLRVYKRFRDSAFMEVNPDRYGYINTTFAIYPASAYNPVTKILDTTVEPESTIILKDAEDDSVYGDSDILDPGIYYVTETRRIKGCTQNTDIYGPVEIKETDSGVINLHDRVNNADYPSMASNNWIYNDPFYFSGKILTKTDDSGLPVEGAIYSVQYSGAENVEDFSTEYTWYFRTDANGDLSYDYAHYVAGPFSYNGITYTSDELIQNKPKTLAMLPFGFLKIKEIMPPSDIYETDSNTYTIELVAQKDAAGQYTIRRLEVKGGVPVSIDRLRYWKLTVEKASKASSEVLGLNSYSLAGATFAVFTDQECTKLAQLYSDDKLTVKVPNNVFTTDANGKAPTYFLKAGIGTTKYYVRELTPPKGHQLVMTPVEVTVSMPADALQLKTASFKDGFSEPYDFMELDALVEKLSMHGNPIQDVVFKVCYYDDSTANAAQLKKTWYLKSDDRGKVYMDQAHVYTGDPSMKSDPFYTDPSSGKVMLPIGGFVTIQEVKAPASYIIDDTIQSFATKKQMLSVTRKYNELVPCRVRLKKYDKSGAKPLEGVQFELKFVKATERDTDLAVKYQRLLKEGETVTVSTDKKGEISFDNLEQGIYEITEVKTVPGQILLKDKITVQLPITMTREEAESFGNVDFSSAKEDAGYTNKWFFYDCLYEITNEPQFKIPQTGGFGGWHLGYLGIAFMAMAGAFMVFRLKRKDERGSL